MAEEEGQRRRLFELLMQARLKLNKWNKQKKNGITAKYYFEVFFVEAMKEKKKVKGRTCEYL